MVDLSPDTVNSGNPSFVMDCDRWLVLAGPRERALYSNLVAIERLVRRSTAYYSKYDVVYRFAPCGDESACPMLAIRRTDDGKPVRFATIGIDTTAGRCFLKYQSSWYDGAHTEYRSYFADTGDAACYLIYVLSRQSEAH
jgi:hypothetical protein